MKESEVIIMRNIFIVNATQAVTSESHPEGLYSTISGYPKTYDSRAYLAADGNPNGDADKAFRMARAEYLSRVSAIITADNPTRAMATITMERADGTMIYHECIGAFPDMAPAPEPEPEPEEAE